MQCRDSEEAVPGPSVFPSGEPGVSGDFWVQSQKWRATLRFLLQLEKRPSSIEPNSVVSREAPPNTTVSLNSQRLPEKLPEVTGTSRRNPEFPEVTRERLGESFFNVS